MAKLSAGSPAHRRPSPPWDLNPDLLGDREEVFFGPYLQHLCAPAARTSSGYSRTARRKAGINAADAIFHNDPRIGCNHKADVSLASPVFDPDGEIICRVTNPLHQYDIGGIAPGSFCPSAPDVHVESPPPIKIVDGGALRQDVADVYLRQSRVPDYAELDLRARIASVTQARQRVEGLIERYGAENQRQVMDKIRDDSESSFLRRLRENPDEIWRDVTYLKESGVGDRGIYRLQMSVRKEGITLTAAEGPILSRGRPEAVGDPAWSGC